MRNNEQFKAYVYEKADVARAKNKRMHAAWARGAVAFSLLVVVGGTFLYANGGMANKAMAPAAKNSASAEIARYAESGTPAEAFGYSALAEAVSVECDSEPVSAATAGAECKALPETVAAGTYAQYMYSAVITDAASVKVEYTVAENAAEYTGDLTDIDFSKNVALVITTQNDIASWKITYADDRIVVLLTAGGSVEKETAYTILLAREKYTGQEIAVCYK